mmetsp:Transcript_77312/g.151697  ORF Transcript_77312/g.151697 Transcript_77312/m.151697 type:complete len:283 (-) Transcript_77312:36-884(-)
MAAEQDPCMSRVIAASVLENEAIDLDRRGDIPGAVAKYQESEKKLAEAISMALPDHAEDHPKLVQHRQEIVTRVEYLRGLGRGAQPTIPVEDQIRAVQLGMRATTGAQAALNTAGGAKTVAAVAALGAGAGFLVLGSTIGTGLSIVGGAVAASYCATRSDKVGEATRAVGGLAVKGAEKAAELNEKHKVTDRMMEAGTAAAAKAKETDQKYGFSTKITTGVKAAVKAAQDFDEKHHATDKVAAGVSRGFSKISEALEKKPSVGSGSSSGAGGAPGAGGQAAS